MLIDQIIEDSQKEDRLKFWWPNQEEGERLMTRFLDELPNAICFDFADVAEAYASHLDRKGFVFNRDAFCILPPYPLTWCETLYQSCKMGCLAKSYYKAQESVRSDALIENMSEQEISSSGVRKLNPSNEVQLVTLRDVYVVGLDCSSIPQFCWLYCGRARTSLDTCMDQSRFQLYGEVPASNANID
jgi:hypothetical protein